MSFFRRISPRHSSIAEVATDACGQAMAEYAIVVAGITGALVGVGFTFLPEFIQALQLYYDNFYLMISLPVP